MSFRKAAALLARAHGGLLLGLICLACLARLLLLPPGHGQTAAGKGQQGGSWLKGTGDVMGVGAGMVLDASRGSLGAGEGGKVAERLGTLLAAAPRNSGLAAADFVYSQVLSEGLLQDDMPPPDKPITFVSALFNIHKADAAASETMRRTFQDDVDWFMSTILALPNPKLIICDADALELLSEVADEESTRFVLVEASEVASWMGQGFTDIQNVQNSKIWRALAPWLAESLQGRLPHHVASNFASLAFLRLAARLDPFKTRGGAFIWLSGRHQCLLGESQRLPERKISNVMRFHLDRFLVTYAYYDLVSEVHGFSRQAFIKYSGMDKSQRRMKLVRGDTLGGRPAHIEVVGLIFELIVRDTLRAGHMGIDESILSIITHRYPGLFHPFSNSETCDSLTSWDRSCPGQQNPQEACAIWDAIMNGLPKGPNPFKGKLL